MLAIPDMDTGKAVVEVVSGPFTVNTPLCHPCSEWLPILFIVHITTTGMETIVEPEERTTAQQVLAGIMELVVVTHEPTTLILPGTQGVNPSKTK